MTDKGPKIFHITFLRAESLSQYLKCYVNHKVKLIANSVKRNPLRS